MHKVRNLYHGRYLAICGYSPLRTRIPEGQYAELAFNMATEIQVRGWVAMAPKSTTAPHSFHPHYLSVLAVVVAGMRWSQYLWPTDPTFLGQPPGILVTFVGFGVVTIVWYSNSQRHTPGFWLTAFLALAGLTWAFAFIANRIHGDAVNYAAFLTLLILALIWVKPPSSAETWTAIRVLGWSTVLMLVTTRILELVNVLPVRHVPNWINWFDRTNYWLPLRELMNLDGRWPGPFGHNGDTAMAGAVLIVIAVAQWHRIASPIFLAVGVFTLMLTSGRASIGAAVAGIATVILFSRKGALSSVPTWVRLLIALGGTAFVAVVLLGGSAGTTGRHAIWPAFFELWLTAPLTGVGTAGISTSGGLTEQFGHAHNLYLDELTRHGVLAFLAMCAMIVIGILIGVRAALKGSSGALAIMVAYVVFNVTEPRNDWIHPTYPALLFMLSVLAANAWITNPVLLKHHSLEYDALKKQGG